MAKGVNITIGRKGWGWGVFLLLIAALVLANQIGDFVELGFWHIIISALSVAFLVQSLVDRSFGSLPIPLAALYFIFQGQLHEHLGFPTIEFWPLALVAILASAGLTALLPKKKWFKKKKRKKNFVNVDISGDGYNVDISDDGYSRDRESTIEGTGRVVIDDEGKSKMKVEESGGDNNPSISVQFGGISRYLHSSALESADLSCNFGSLEVYFDNVTLSPDGADVDVSCNFGSVELYVPRDWTIKGDLSASLGNAEINGMNKQPEDGPELRINGSVSLGNIEVNRI